MVNRILNDYVQGLRRKMLHVPLRVQRRLVNELVAHLEADIVELRRDGRTEEDATVAAIDAFCPLDDVLPMFGPEEGIIRSSTAQWVVKAPKILPRRSSIDGRKWGAAAAGIAVVSLLVAAVFMGPTPTPLATETADPGDVIDVWRFANVTGDLEQEMHVPEVAGFSFDAFGSGCVQISMLSPSGETVGHEGCLDGGWTVSAPETGDWLVRISVQEFTGEIRVTAS